MYNLSFFLLFYAFFLFGYVTTLLPHAPSTPQVSIWDVNHDPTSSSPPPPPAAATVSACGDNANDATAAADDDNDDDEDDGGFDGVAMFAPHYQYVSGLKWLGPDGKQLLSCSYDGSVRVLDIITGKMGGYGFGVLDIVTRQRGGCCFRVLDIVTDK
jgi:WD40 repeat protein